MMTGENKMQNSPEARQEESGKGGDRDDRYTTPDARLKELEAQLKAYDGELARLGKALKTSQDDKKAVEGVIADFKKILEAYGKALENIKTQNADLCAYSKTKTSMLEAAAKDKKERIEDIIKNFDGRIKRTEDELPGLAAALKEARADFEAATAVLQNEVQTLDRHKSHQKTVQDHLKTLDELRKKIEANETENKIATMYFLMTDSFNKVLAQIGCDIVEPAVLAGHLNETWKKMEQAKAEARLAEKNWQEKQAAYTQKQDELKAYRETRYDDILKELEKLDKKG